MNTNMTGTAGIDGYQKSLHPCTLDESRLSIRKVKPPYSQKATIFHGLQCPVTVLQSSFKMAPILQ